MNRQEKELKELHAPEQVKKELGLRIQICLEGVWFYPVGAGRQTWHIVHAPVKLYEGFASA